MSERIRLRDYPKKTKQWLLQQPPFPIDMLNTRALYWINRPVLRWRDPHPEALKRDSIRVFITGHAVDHEWDKTKPSRFPDSWASIRTAETRINAELEKIYNIAHDGGVPLELVFCSATTGTDLLGLQWALGKMKSGVTDISIRSFLGYDKETFVNDSVKLSDHEEDRQKFWYGIYSEVKARGLLIEPEFRNRKLRKMPRPPVDAVKPDRFKDKINQALVKRYGADKKGNPLYKHFDEMNDMMVRYLRRDDFAIALWDGSEPLGRGGTVYALDAAAKRIKNDEHIIFIEREGILGDEHLAKIQEKNGGQPIELTMARARMIKSQVEARLRMQRPQR